MSVYTITIDGGTTNTRCILWDSRRVKIAEQAREIGVRNTAIDGDNHRLKSAVKDCLEQLLSEQNLTFRDVKHVIASGMITSDVGIVEVPHLTAPADLEKIARSTVSILLPEIFPIPIHFIPGIKNATSPVTLENYETMDIMRGEEVESFALIHRFHNGSPMLLVLPGSHNKFVSVNRQKEITGCLTSISGELLSAITNDTILAKSVNHSFVKPEEYDREWLLRGYRNARDTGLGRACFSGRILHLFAEKDTSKIANYILGAVLQGDVTAVRHSRALSVSRDTMVVVCGKAPLQKALTDIFAFENMFAEIRTFQPEKNVSLSSMGAYLVAEKLALL